MEIPNLKPHTPKTDAGANGAGRLLSLGLDAFLELGVWNLELVALTCERV
jgi:hypothetical protein